MAGTRDAIMDAMRTKLIADGSLTTLTGATASDKRVYSGFDKPDRFVDATFPGFVVIYPILSSMPVADAEDRRFQVSCFAKKLTTCNRMADRVDAVLHRKTLSATGWTDVHMTRLNDMPTYDDRDGVFHIVMEFMVGVYS